MPFDCHLKDQLEKSLVLILTELKLDLPQRVHHQFVQYLELLTQWNQAYNLTAIRDPQKMMVKHIADSLAVIPYLRREHKASQHLLDVGSGAGLPGIILALALPDWNWTLLDSNGKKTRFLVQVKAALGLENVEVVQARVESFQPAHCFHAVIARAWARLEVMLAMTQHLYCADGILWAMKGAYPQDELQELQQSFMVYPLQVPGLEEQRHLIRVCCSNFLG